MDNRRGVSGIICILHHGLHGMTHLKPMVGGITTLYHRFVRWSRLRVFERIFAALAN